jgi:hypothetical protein
MRSLPTAWCTTLSAGPPSGNQAKQGITSGLEMWSIAGEDAWGSEREKRGIHSRIQHYDGKCSVGTVTEIMFITKTLRIIKNRKHYYMFRLLPLAIWREYGYWKMKEYKFDVHGSVHRRLLSRNNNKMQLCNRIYYSKVYWRLNLFRAAHRSSSGALNCICSLWFICPCGDRPLSRLSGKWITCISHSALATAGHHMDI